MADNTKIINALNTILELELAGVVRYTHYGLMVYGYSRIPIISWLRAQASESLDHANQAGEVITNLGQHFWTSLAQFNIKFYGYGTIQVSVPERCAKMFQGGLPPSEKQMKAALKIKREAEVNGFDYSH